MTGGVMFTRISDAMTITFPDISGAEAAAEAIETAGTNAEAIDLGAVRILLGGLGFPFLHEYVKRLRRAFGLGATAAPAPKRPAPRIPAAAIAVEVGHPGRSERRYVVPGNGKSEWFKDIEIGPEMVVVPAGRFTMG